MSLFNKGYSAVREEQQRQEEAREKMGKQLWRFFISENGGEAEVRFLTEEPINFYEHNIKAFKNGKEYFKSEICTAKNGSCPHCDKGDRPVFKGAFLIYDMRPYEYTDKDGNKQKRNGQLKLYVAGARILSQLDRLSNRYGLTERNYFITRSGLGTSTSYMFDRGDDVSPLTKSEIESLLPEKLREMYDGTMDSLYDIVIDQLNMLVSDNSNSSSEDSSSELSEEYDANKNLVNIDDDEEEPPFDTEEEEVQKPKRSSLKSIYRKK